MESGTTAAKSQQGGVWTDNIGDSSASHSGYSAGLINRLAAVGLCPDERLRSRVYARIEHFGSIELARYSPDHIRNLPADKARWVLGCGFAVTEFLIAPVLGPASPSAICSLGALVNLMVVICDRLLDCGTSPDTVFTDPESPVLGLLHRYQAALRTLDPDARVQAISEKLIARMITAERQTVAAGHQLEYRD